MLTPPESVTTEEMLALIAELNARDEVDGILIQLPLPKHVDTRRLLEAVSPEKDVDGFHPINVGRLQSAAANSKEARLGWRHARRRGSWRFCGAAGCRWREECGGAGAVGDCGQAGGDDAAECFGDGDGVPQQDGGDWRHTREAEILVAAIGRPGFVTAEMVKPGATLIDVGINRVTDAAEVARFFPGDAARAAQFAKRGSTLVGDIHPAAFALAGAYTPVPGGVGALTIAMLMKNTVQAARARRGGRGCERPCVGGGDWRSAMLRVGLTGGLGSGKSTAAQMFRGEGRVCASRG
jgi:methylenetetrahydrofolate dehydrogenase (NADP+)/methenyltetrahydrofolate cyclohydrolase